MREMGWPAGNGVLAKIRWCYLVFVAFFTVTFMPQLTLLSTRPLGLRVAGVVGLCLLTAWWVRGYRRKAFAAWAIPFETVAMFAVAMAPVDPFRAMGLLFIGVSFRVLYGGWLQAMSFTALAISAFLLAEHVAALLGTPPAWGLFLQSVPGAIAIALISHSMARAMEQGERAASRERQLSAVGLELTRACSAADLTGRAVAAATALLPDPRGATARLEAGRSEQPRSATELAVPVVGRDSLIGLLIVDAPNGVPGECRAALDTLAHALGQSLVMQQLNDDLRMRAEHDSLTGLYNRSTLHARLHDEIRRRSARPGTPEELHVILLDLDHFKAVNDSAGHAAGDEVLRVTGQRLQASLRAGDMAARFGGDEFAAVLVGCSGLVVDAVVARVTAAVRQPIALPSGRQVTVGGSVGLASWRAGISADELLHAADMAMYTNKRSGRVSTDA